MPSTARRVQGFTESWIREMTRRSLKYGAINLAQGFPDFRPPPELEQALEEASRAGRHQYSITWGQPVLRRAIADKVQRWWGVPVDPETEVTVTIGCTEGIVSSLFAILDAGDEVILFEPAHENYVPATILAGATPRWVPLRPPAFTFDPDDLRRAVGPRTKAIVLNTPHNPTGRVFTRQELEIVCRACLEHDLILVTDEIYEHIVFDGRQHIPPATLPGMRERTISVSGLSKTFTITGWRLGYVVAPPPLTDALRKVHDFLAICAPTPLQEGAGAALPLLVEWEKQLAGIYQAKRDLFVTALSRIGMPCAVPEGAYYAMASVTGLGFADDWSCNDFLMKEVGIAGVPGSSFYHHKELGAKHLRFAFCKNEHTLNAVVEKLAAFAATRRS